MPFQILVLFSLVATAIVILAILGLCLYIIWSIIWKIYEQWVLYCFHKKMDKIGKEVLEEARKNFLTNLRKTRKIKSQGVRNNYV